MDRKDDRGRGRGSLLAKIIAARLANPGNEVLAQAIVAGAGRGSFDPEVAPTTSTPVQSSDESSKSDNIPSKPGTHRDTSGGSSTLTGSSDELSNRGPIAARGGDHLDKHYPSAYASDSEEKSKISQPLRDTDTKYLEDVTRKLSIEPASQLVDEHRIEREARESIEKISTQTSAQKEIAMKTSAQHHDETVKLETSVQEQKNVKQEYLGTSGICIDVVTNYLRLDVEPGRGVFEYDVRFTPDLDSKGLRIKLLNEHMNELGGVKTFDGVALYLPIKLQEKKFTSVNPADGSVVNILVTFKRKKRLGECVHLYNVLFGRIMGSLQLVQFKRQHFDPTAPKILPQHELEIWPGYVTAVDEFEGGVMLCLDVSHRVLRQKTVLELLRSMARDSSANLKDVAKKSLIGTCIITRYNNKTYRVDDVEFSMSPMSSFENSQGIKTTFVEYYKRQYGLDILDLEQPLLISNSKIKISGRAEPVENKLCLIPELAFLTGLTDANRNDFRLMKDIASFTRITPNQRVYAIKKFVNNVNNNKAATELLASWGLKLNSDCTKLPARVLNPEDIRFGAGQILPGKDIENGEWSRASFNKQALNVVNVTVWALIHTQRDQRCARDFLETVKRCGPPMGITILEPLIITLPNDRTESFVNGIHSVMKSRPDMQLLVFVFPTAREDRYAAIKKLCCIEYAIASQVINSKTISRPDKIRPIVQKIALQINCKLGGSLWSVSVPLKNCMIVGIDTYHDAKSGGKSVVGFVSSMNQNCSKYFSQVAFQNPREELGQSMQHLFRTSLKKFFEYNGAFPERVIFFRDGVGNGQFSQCKEVEVEMMEECFDSPVFEKKPLLTFVIVQKRINTRIMSQKSGNYDNPGPGTILDHTVTRKELQDFFLVPQNVRQGTVSPTHYVVLKDTAQMKPDHVQRLTFKMCHLYYNWAGTVRVPACCQYAHKLAYLIGESVRSRPDPRLADRLYYL